MSRSGTPCASSFRISAAIHFASASWVSAKQQSTGGPAGRVGRRSLGMRSLFFEISELAAARISGAER